MSPTERIQELLSQRPGLKAQQIANELGLERSQVATTLHTLLGGELIQDTAYRWWPKTHLDTASIAPARHSLLANLCRYYLACLAHESGPAVSLPAADDGSGYICLPQLPFSRPNSLETAGRAVKKLVQKVRRDRGQLALYAGYAIRVRTLLTRNEEETRVEPLLLYPLEDAPDMRSLQPVTGIPLFNLEVLKSLPAADTGNLMDEAVHLSEELGLANSDEDLPPWDEIVLRLQHCRADWNWREALNPHALSEGPPLHELKPGIYNRAILFGGTRSPFTYGLEIELRKLAQLEQETISGTALGEWLRGGIETAPPEDRPLLEVVPLNTEQRQAVLQGLAAPLTVVTGPPGTGKSQVVASLLVNAAWQGSSALFSSKNNHAVDVVESRVNEMGTHPLLLRLGKEEHHAQLAQNLTASLAESAQPGDAASYEQLLNAHGAERRKFESVQTAIVEVVSLRNRVDELERAAEPARSLFGAGFAALREFEPVRAERRLQSLAHALEAAKGAGQPAMVRMFWDSVKDRRYKSVADAAAGLQSDAELLGIPVPAAEASAETLPEYDEFHRALAERLHWAAKAHEYWAGLGQLQATRPLNDLARDLAGVAEQSARNSLELWRTWLRLWPVRWNPEQRKLLSEYVSLLQMIAGGDRYDEGAGHKVFRRYYKLFPEVTKLLPCWAVTSLSARGRLPFEPAVFDVAVIDEASQCDIASALPLLYRARRAVIIGDPLQLKHVSAVAPQQDRLILAANGLAEGRAAWAYSVNSLFDLARSLCRQDDIVNLRDHHRSHRDIISFSNRHFYRGGLRIATDPGKLKRPNAPGPVVRWIDVRGKVLRPPAGGAANGIEADAVLAELRKLVVEEGYTGDIGVVTPFRAHANRIRALVHQDGELSRRLAALAFVVDTVHGFQGDERDVIFFSPVVSVGVGDTALRFLKSHANLFNVAVTRARSELIVVGDRQACVDSGVAYLASFVEYARDLASRDPQPSPIAESGAAYPAVAHPEHVSQWERIFYDALYAAGVRAVPQYAETPYALDFALFDGDRKLDIEIDGEQYHRNWDGESCRRDQIRSQRLNDMGWDVLRFWVYEIRDDIDGCVARVKAWLAGPR